jgi:hypothetical protein
MTWSYSGNPASSSKDMVRFLIGDTVSTAQLMQDEEINAILTYQSNPIYAAAYCADAMCAKFAREADLSIGATSISASQKSKAYCALADRLRASGGSTDGTGIPSVSMFVGGISVSGNSALAEDDDLVQPPFGVGQDDNPSTPNGAVDPKPWS